MSLPQKVWEAKMVSIEKANDLSILPTDELLGKLLTHEIKMNQVVEEEMAKNDKSIAFKTSRDTSDSDTSENKDEYAIILKKIIRILLLTSSFENFLLSFLIELMRVISLLYISLIFS